MSQSDLFATGNASSRGQADLFTGGLLRPAPASTLPDPAVIRQRLTALLTTARRATAMPWKERDARMWQTVFPQMANWLPEAEANQLRLEFAQEFDRLQRAA